MEPPCDETRIRGRLPNSPGMPDVRPTKRRGTTIKESLSELCVALDVLVRFRPDQCRLSVQHTAEASANGRGDARYQERSEAFA